MNIILLFKEPEPEPEPGAGAGAGFEICLKPEPENQKSTGSGNAGRNTAWITKEYTHLTSQLPGTGYYLVPVAVLRYRYFKIKRKASPGAQVRVRAPTSFLVTFNRHIIRYAKLKIQKLQSKVRK